MIAVVKEGWTALKLLQTSARYLAEKGSPSPRLDAELLLAHVLSTTRLRLYVDFDKPITDLERTAYRELVRRRASGEPVAYLIGQREFYGRGFAVDARVLVPRPETELLIDAALRLLPKNAPLVLADLGTGSGAIAVTLAAEFPRAKVHAVDCSAPALDLARHNAESLGVSDRVCFYHGFWEQPVALLRFDAVLSNPPYVATGDRAVEPGVRKFEPPEALFAGPTGLEAIEHLANALSAMLKPGGWWICEFGAGQRAQLEGLLDRTGWVASFENDLAGLPRLFLARRQKDGS